MPEPNVEASGMWTKSTFDPGGQAASLVLGTMLITTGIVLLIERMHREGVPTLWPLLLVVAGVARMGAGQEERDEAWWLIGVGWWLLLKTLAPALLQQSVWLAIVAAGVVTWRRALTSEVPARAAEDSHVC